MERTPEIPDFAASQLFLRRLAYRLVRDEAQAEDLVQETWATWVEKRPRSVTEPRAWLARVLRNRAFNLKRTADRRGAPESLSGRPDPSAPETDGTLEAQAQLIEALRKLDEPYRSTLLQRYYHDHTAKEIAERTGTPVNTVKARLARGLERLRGAMDRRYHGDRRAWCHWLTPILVGAPVVPPPQASAPGGSITAAAGGSKLVWLGVLGTVAVVSGLKVLRDDGGRGREIVEHTLDTGMGPDFGDEPVREGRTPVHGGTAAGDGARPADETAAQAKPAPKPQVVERPAEPVVVFEPRGGASSRAERFEWPQYAGNAQHDTSGRIQDTIEHPEVLWYLPGLLGQPTLSEGSLYSGGVLLVRLDPATGRVLGAGVDEVDLVDQAQMFESLLPLMTRLQEGGEVLPTPQELTDVARLFLRETVGTPAISKRSVISRRRDDGSVKAYDRSLEDVQWEWKAEPPVETELPGCLALGGIYLAPLGTAVVALDAKNGEELWRFDAGSTIETVPATSRDRAYVVTRGSLFALDLVSGHELWRGTNRSSRPGIPRHVSSHVAVLAKQLLVTSSEDNDFRMNLLDARSGARIRSTVSGSAPTTAAPCLLPGGDFFVLLGPAGSGVCSTLRVRDGEEHDAWSWNLRLEVPCTPVGIPVLVGKQKFVYATREGFLRVSDAMTGQLLWSFQAPDGAAVLDFVHTGERIYVSTSVGLFCLGNGAPAPDQDEPLVVRWSGDDQAWLDLMGVEWPK